MRFITALALATTAAMLGTSALAASRIESKKPGAAGPSAVPGASAKRNPYEGNPGGKPSAAEHRAQKSQRMAERRARVRAAIANLPNEPDSKLQRMDKEELERALRASDENAAKRGADVEEQKRGLKAGLRRETSLLDQDLGRKLWGNSNSGGGGDPYDPAGNLVSETQYYDKWQQAYRFLGGFIDCTHSWSEGSHDSGDNNQNESGSACSRWMMWAAYIDPNYAGGGYSEYYGDDAPGSLDCHSPDTDWELIGVYRQEFYQYIEQISKHLWAIDDYDYIVALAGLEYMTDSECFAVGNDENGNQLYAEVQPLEGGAFQMGLYSDAQCIELNTQTSYTYSDFASTSDLDLGSKDETDDDAFHAQAYEYWADTQEYTLTNLNTVYNDYKYCTSCVDYPTYQDGYFIGDDGTDDDDLINQCWKFYSHDSFNCDADCIAMGAEQGTITWVAYGGKQFGTLIEGQYSSDHDSTALGGANYDSSSSSQASGANRMDRLKANLFLTFAGVVFVATFLAFAVARGSSKKKKKSRSRSRRLLDADYGASGARRSSSRSKSRSRRSTSGASGGRSSRSARSKSKSRSQSKSVKSGGSRSKSRSRRSSGDYEPPSASEKKSRSQSRSRKSSSSSRRRTED